MSNIERLRRHQQIIGDFAAEILAPAQPFDPSDPFGLREPEPSFDDLWADHPANGSGGLKEHLERLAPGINEPATPNGNPNE
jgi:hypothetical protein